MWTYAPAAIWRGAESLRFEPWGPAISRIRQPNVSTFYVCVTEHIHSVQYIYIHAHVCVYMYVYASLLYLTAWVESHSLQLHSSICFLVSVPTVDLRHKFLQEAMTDELHKIIALTFKETGQFGSQRLADTGPVVHAPMHICWQHLRHARTHILYK